MSIGDPDMMNAKAHTADKIALNEAEIQVLASLAKAVIEGTSTDTKSLEADGSRFSIFLEDWSDAYESLAAKGLVGSGRDGLHLSETGRPLAQAYHRERPDMYWYHYQRYYPAAWASETHTRFCERVFGRDLCQEGQTDMASLEQLIEHLDLKSGDDMLDLGCGAGIIAEYISDKTGASATGLDYASSAIAEAAQRTEKKRSRLIFLQGDMNALQLTDRSFDAVISLDTLYWVADLEDTLSKVARALRPGGRMGIFMNQHARDGDTSEALEAQNSELSQALSKLGLSFETYDYTRQIAEFWYRFEEAAKALREDFATEGNGFIGHNFVREAEEDYLPDVRAGRIARYLYIVRC